MSYCINPKCLQPQNSDQEKYCQSCGFSLLLHNRYRPLQPIGQGGFGRTFLARDESRPSHPHCVIKEFDFPEKNASYNHAVKLFNQEAVRLDCLGEHPQIPRLLAYFEEHQLLLLVQEYIPGKTLLQEFEHDGLFDEPKIWQILRDLLPVLKFVHDRDIIHRDIKPANLIRRRLRHPLPPSPIAFNNPDTIGETRTSAAIGNLSSKSIRDRPVPLPPPPPRPSGKSINSESKIIENGLIVLIDFGVAKLLTATTISRTGTIIGSPEFMAPEQTRGRVFPASDLYSLGATCLYLLTGVSPWNLYDTVLEKWVWRDFLSPERMVSDKLGKVLDKLVNNQILQRYNSAAEVLAAISTSPPKTSPPTQKVLKPQSPPKTAHKASKTRKHKTSPPSSEPANLTDNLKDNFQAMLGRIIPALTQPPDDEYLASERGGDYGQLQKLLATHRWRKADRETWIMLCRALGKGGRPYLHYSDLNKLPCEDLTILDNLWVKYSNHRFGFSIQAQIYLQEESDYGKFCDRVGWLKSIGHDPSLGFRYNLNIPTGHLPTRIWVMNGGKWWLHLETITQRLKDCGLI
ncbi:serine/threonine-protein kinase [Limnospira fusiformis KN01]|uniref:serine/threonine-protein kinase n=1 Tax=Limnospira TaxID=2596745 RepID=UPI001658A2B7|nr:MULTISPECIES: serine/threonine-protein kinase [Limnospira]MDT9199272.1 serine/threonine-protein kinase [Limnospira sp. PMC 1042.18]ULB45706.1 serine/threonine-protein kinase [Limnospira fusiformis KN01]